MHAHTRSHIFRTSHGFCLFGLFFVYGLAYSLSVRVQLLVILTPSRPTPSSFFIYRVSFSHHTYRAVDLSQRNCLVFHSHSFILSLSPSYEGPEALTSLVLLFATCHHVYISSATYTSHLSESPAVTLMQT